MLEKSQHLFLSFHRYKHVDLSVVTYLNTWELILGGPGRPLMRMSVQCCSVSPHAASRFAHYLRATLSSLWSRYRDLNAPAVLASLTEFGSTYQTLFRKKFLIFCWNIVWFTRYIILVYSEFRWVPVMFRLLGNLLERFSTYPYLYCKIQDSSVADPNGYRNP
jgi:hypothetical protein